MNTTLDALGLHKLDPPRQRAIVDLVTLIQAHYPSTTFTLREGVDDPEATYLIAHVDMEDPDEILDLTIDRVMELQLDKHIPLYVLPVHTAEQVAQTLRSLHKPGHVTLLGS
jgi:hypothetical protein